MLNLLVILWVLMISIYPSCIRQGPRNKFWVHISHHTPSLHEKARCNRYPNSLLYVRVRSPRWNIDPGVQPSSSLSGWVRWPSQLSNAVVRSSWSGTGFCKRWEAFSCWILRTMFWTFSLFIFVSHAREATWWFGLLLWYVPNWHMFLIFNQHFRCFWLY